MGVEMSGNTFGKLFSVTSFGESHGPAVGCVVDGCPPGLALSAADIQAELDRRRALIETSLSYRNEPDQVEILSGIFEGKTTGTPIALLIRNQDRRASDFTRIDLVFRPGHGDYSYQAKYGIRDHRGGGRASARETVARVAAGAIARKWLKETYGTVIRGRVSQIGDMLIPLRDWEDATRENFFLGDRNRVDDVAALLDGFLRSGDSIGSRLEIVAEGILPGWGEPVFDRLDADIAKAMMGINAVRGVEIGDGFAAVAQRGSEHGDEMSPEGFLSNHAGGVLGGISTGQPLVVSVAVKPTPSIHLPRRSVDVAGNPVVLRTRGKRDPCVGIRAVPIAEAMLAVVLMDHALRDRGQNGNVQESRMKAPFFRALA